MRQAEDEMDEIIDFAAVLIKLVIILLVFLMAGTLVLAPITALDIAVPVLMLVVPLFVLVTLLDLVGVLRRTPTGRVAAKGARHWARD